MTKAALIDPATMTLELVAAMNHEHGNLLAALKAWVDAPQIGMPPAEALANARKVVEKMVRLQRAEQLCVAGLRNESRESISLGELLDFTLALAEPRLRARGVTISIDQPEVNVTVYCNPGRTIAELFFMLLRLAGQSRESSRTMILSADCIGDDAQLTAFLTGVPNTRETLVISARVDG